MSEQLLVRLAKLIEQIYRNVFTYTTKHNETQALSTEKCLRQVQENRRIIIKEGSKGEEETDVKQKNKNKNFVLFLFKECIRRF